METVIYKQVDGCSIAADIYPAAGPAPAPVLLWLHGGALITGGRSGIPRLLLEELTGAGFALVSADYRLAPETKLPAIVEDVEDAARWVRGPGAGRFGFDPERLAILGPRFVLWLRRHRRRLVPQARPLLPLPGAHPG